jgi:hypothetical protein
MDSDNWSDFSGYTHLELYPNSKYKSFVPQVDMERKTWRYRGREYRPNSTLEFSESGDVVRVGPETLSGG